MTTITLLSPVSVTATGRGPDVDVSRLHGTARAVFASLNTAGTNPELTCKLQASAAPAVGLSQTMAGTTENKLRSGATTNVKIGSKFTQSGARSIKRVFLRLKAAGEITAGKKLTLTIETDSTGSPSGTVIGTAGTVLCSAVPTDFGWVPFEFATPVDVADNTVYHAILAGDYDASAINCVIWRSATVASGGTIETNDGTNWAAVTATQKNEIYAEQYTFADVTGGGFTKQETAGSASVQSRDLWAPDLPQYASVYSTIGGTDNPAFTASVVLVAQRVQEQ
jgi:hypothetical protein